MRRRNSNAAASDGRRCKRVAVFLGVAVETPGCFRPLRNNDVPKIFNKLFSRNIEVKVIERETVKRGVWGDSQRRRWIRGITAAGLLITLGIILLAYWRGQQHKPKGQSQTAQLPQNVNQRLSGLTFTRSEGGRHLFTIHADRSLSYKQGSSVVLHDVYAEFFGQLGKRHDVLRTAQGEYNPKTGDLATPGDVQIILNAPTQRSASTASETGNSASENTSPQPGDEKSKRQPVFVNTSKVSSQNHGTLMASDTPVHFRIGDVSGSATGLIYDAGKGQLELKQDVNATYNPAEPRHNEPPVQLAASRLQFDDSTRQAQLSGPVKINQGGRSITAEHATVFLNARNRITEILLQGQVNSTDRAPKGDMNLKADSLQGLLDPQTHQVRKLMAQGHVHGISSQPGAVTHADAQMVELNFSGNNHTPTDGKATGQVHLTVAQSGRPARKPMKQTAQTAQLGGGISREELLSEEVHFTFRPKGKSLKDAQTAGPGTLLLYPESPKEGLRTATADQFLMTFGAKNRFETLRGQGNTKMVFSPPPDEPKKSPAETTGRQLVAVFDPATRDVRSLEQSGDFHFRQADLEATADEAHDSVLTQTLTLLGHPQIWDPTARVHANRILIHLDSNTAEGVGQVQAMHFDTRKDSTLPTNVVADWMTADRKSQTAHYEGHVRAWHGTDVIESASLDFNQKLRELSSDTRVLTSHVQPASKAPTSSGGGKRTADTIRSAATSQNGASPLTVRADGLKYFDEDRKARYTGNVELNTGDTRLRSDELDVYFSTGKTPDESAVQRAVADGHVHITQSMRYADGIHADYDAALGEIIMTGGPPTLYDAEKGLTSGQRLTFYIHGDRLQVDGGSNSPTVSKHRVAQ